MYLTVYSIAVAVFWATVFTKLAASFRKRIKDLRYFSLYPFMLVLFFSTLRILFPLELPYTYIVESWKILPWIQGFSRIQLVSFGFVTITPGVLFLTVWILGAAVVFCRHMQNYIRFHRLLHSLPAASDSRLQRMLAEADPQGKLAKAKVIVHEAVASPALSGFLRPVIILPDMYFDDEELLGIFLHESAHFKSRHIFAKLAAELACICFWWNPLLKELPEEISHALELHSDKAVCKKLDKKQQLKYLSVILKVLRNASRPDSLKAASLSLADRPDKRNMEQRFQMILEDHYQKKHKPYCFATLLALLVFLLSYAVIPQPASLPPSDTFGTMDALSSDSNFYCVEKSDGYDLYEYPNHFIVHMDHLEEQFKNLKIYKYQKGTSTNEN